MLDYAGPARWRWRLTSATGAFLADHQVALDPSSWQHEALLNLQGYLRSYTAPDRRREQEIDLLARVGDWLASSALGPVADELARQRGAVRVEVPADAAIVGYLPWELARVGGRTLASSHVTFVMDHRPRSVIAKRPVGERLRMLAVFSVPEGAGALNLRKERHALARLVHTIAQVNDKAIELRVLQYGATRERLAEALLEQEGWDVVHLSGHGLPAGVLLETSSGERDRVSSTELVDLLELASGQIKLVTLSACSSAAVTADEQLSLLGITPPESAAEPGGGSLPAVATAVTSRLDCAVVAMRYEVVDTFAIALAGEFYDLVLGKGQTVARALPLALTRAGSFTPLSVVTPTLFGAAAGELTLVPPQGGPVVFDLERVKLAEFPPQPDRFVGRVGPMARATAALAPDSGKTGVLFHGMAGGGKSACALELAYTHQDSFPLLAWYSATSEPSVALTDFALALERQLPGLKIAHVVNDLEALRGLLPALTELLAQHRILIVLDNAESLLTPDGQWRDERWEHLVSALTAHEGLSRLVITSRTRFQVADSVPVEAVHALSLREAMLLAREWPELKSLIEDDFRLAARVIAIVQGHPKLIELANGLAADRSTLAERLAEAQRVWKERGVRLEPFLQGDDPAPSDTDYLSVLTDWTHAAAASLPASAREMFLALCCCEEADRLPRYFQATEEMLSELDRGLVEITPARYRIHPGVAEAGRALAGPDFVAAVDAHYGELWLSTLNAAHDDGDTRAVLGAAVRGVPYFRRAERWYDIYWVCSKALRYDSSPAMLGKLLPYLDVAALGSRGTRHEMTIRGLHARALGLLDAQRGIDELRALVAESVRREDFTAASILSSDLVGVYRRAGLLEEALELSEQVAGHTELAGLGPFSRAANEHDLLGVLSDMGRSREVLDGVHRVLASLPEESGDRVENVDPRFLVENLLHTGTNAAARLREFDIAMNMGEQLIGLKRARGAADVEVADTVQNVAQTLLFLGRHQEAKERLLWCRAVFERSTDMVALGRNTAMLAQLEGLLARSSRAVDLHVDGLRLAYSSGNPVEIAKNHHNTGIAHGHAEPVAWCAHYMAAALIYAQTGDEQVSGLVEGIGDLFFVHGRLFETFDDVCAIAGNTGGVELRALLDRLPVRFTDNAALTAALLVEADRYAKDRLAEWSPIMDEVVQSASSGVVSAGLAAELTRLESHASGVALATSLRRVVEGERVPELWEGQVPLAYGIVRGVLGRLEGGA
ncbi:CHAT domain-containing protein [Lentzea californiensis]|nr:CHAT domain-containing protein [Lentzea californiensis]